MFSVQKRAFQKYKKGLSRSTKKGYIKNRVITYVTTLEQAKKPIRLKEQ